MDEKALVQRILKGEEKAKTEFFSLYKDQVYATCSNFLGYRDPDAPDVVQETFLTAFQKLGEFEFKAGLGTWLTQICIYKTYQQIEKRKRALALAHEELETLSRPKALQGFEAEAEKEEQRSRLGLITRCLEKLKKECRDIVQLRDIESQSYSAIGKALKLPIGTVMSRLARCKQALKALVKDELERDKHG